MARDYQLFLPTFDATADYVAIRPFTFRGKTMERGTPFDKTLVTHRTLRQMYEARQLAKIEGTGNPRPVRQPLRFDRIHKQQVGVDERTGRFKYGLFRDGIRILPDVVSLDGQRFDPPMEVSHDELAQPETTPQHSAIAAQLKRQKQRPPDTTTFVNEPAVTVSETPAPEAGRKRRERNSR